MDGCENDLSREKNTLEITLIDYHDTTAEVSLKAGHISGVGCSCTECKSLKDKEDRWILRVGSLYGGSGLNTRDEVKSKSRCNYYKRGT